jgi:glycogen phosphorylase
VGDDNIFIFGMTTEEVAARRQIGINMGDVIGNSELLRGVLDAVRSGVFSPDEPGRYADLVDALTNYDHFLVCADFDAYYAKQRQVAERWADKAAWWRSSVINTANMGWFSSDRSIADYCERIWRINPAATKGSV